jgi:peptidyl-prolyl cis-trans isomerase B (cyclophilin B)
MSEAVAALALLAALAQEPAAAPNPPAPAPSVAPPAAPEATLTTEEGEIVIRLLPELAPRHVAHFVATAKRGGYDGTAFHRVILGGIIQGGDPLSKDPAQAARYGTGGLGLLEAEFSDRPFARGTVAAARRPSSKDSGGSQFFICLSDQPSLLGQYTIFGEVVSGIEVADRIAQTPADGDKPRSRVELKRVVVREPAR